MNQTNQPQYPPQELQLPDEESIDIKKYIFLILNHWWWFAITIFISLTIAYLINRYSQEEYNVNCSLIIGEKQSSIGGIEDILDELSRLRNRKRKAVVQNEISILKSYRMARMALEELDFDITYTAVGRRNIAETQMYKKCPFVVIPDTTRPFPKGRYDITILSEDMFRLNVGENIQEDLYFGEYFENKNTRFQIFLRHPATYKYDPLYSNKFYFIFNNTNALANAYKNRLSVAVNDEKGTVLTLSLRGYVPEKIADYLNKLSEVYIRSNLEEKNQTSVNTIQFIEQQLHGVVDSLESTGLRLQRFRSANRVIDISAEGSYLFQKMQDLQSEMAILDIRERYYRYLLEYIEEKTDFSDVVAPSVVGIQDELLNNLVSQLNDLNLQRRNISLTVVENSPQLSVINNQIINTRNALEENLKSLIKSNSISIQELNERINKIEIEVSKLPGTERQLINIERDFTINDQIYTFLLQKRAEAGITKASNTPDNRILDIARAENALLMKPNSSRNYTLGFVLGILIPLFLLVIIEYFNNKVVNRKDIEQRINVPILGTIGHNDKTSEIPVFESPKSVLAESFRAFRTNLKYLLKDKKQITLSISSTVSGEGKTFCAVNLATIFAMAGNKTLLVSLDLRRPKIHRIFNIKNDEGISTYLIDKTSIEKCIHETNIQNLYISPAGPIPPNPAELIGSDKMNAFFEVIKTEFKMIVIDTPPVAVVTDALLLNEVIDSNIFVIRHGFSSKQVLSFINDLYQKKGIENMGLIINDVQIKGNYGYSYYDSYGYGYGYGYDYYKQGYYEDDIKKESLLSRLKNKVLHMFS